MNDLKALEDAFAELERRADNAPLRAEAGKSRRPRLVPVAAAVLVAGGLVTGVALLAGGSGDGPSSSVRVGSSASTPTKKLPVAHSVVPTSAKQLEERFRTVLGNTGTFTVTDTGGPVETDGNGNAKPGTGAAIVGVLTANGSSGGYDLQIIKSGGVPGAHCEDLDRADCKIHTVADGASLAVSTEPLEGGGSTQMVDLVRKDGVEFLMHVSNQRDPKGPSTILSPRPPLTTDQMVKIVTSEQW